MRWTGREAHVGREMFTGLGVKLKGKRALGIRSVDGRIILMLNLEL
jgi:hypothetical protein